MSERRYADGYRKLRKADEPRRIGYDVLHEVATQGAFANIILPKALRQARRDRGELGPDHLFTTRHGTGAFALGDRVQITETRKAAGLYNGHAGVIVGIEVDRISLRLDALAGREGRVVTWSAAELGSFAGGGGILR